MGIPEGTVVAVSGHALSVPTPRRRHLPNEPCRCPDGELPPSRTVVACSAAFRATCYDSSVLVQTTFSGVARACRGGGGAAIVRHPGSFRNCIS